MIFRPTSPNQDSLVQFLVFITTERKNKVSTQKMINILEILSNLETSSQDTPQIAVSVQRGNDFVHDINTGISQSFLFGNNTNGEATIVHDPKRINFFSQERILKDDYSCQSLLCHVSVFGETPFVENSRSCDLKVESLEKLYALKEEFLSVPLMMEIYFRGHRQSGNIIYQLPRECFIVTINPKHPDVRQEFEKAFDKAIHCMQEGKNFSIEISVYDGVKSWL